MAIDQTHTVALPRAWTSLAVPELTRVLEAVLGPRLIAVIVAIGQLAIPEMIARDDPDLVQAASLHHLRL